MYRCFFSILVATVKVDHAHQQTLGSFTLIEDIGNVYGNVQPQKLAQLWLLCHPMKCARHWVKESIRLGQAEIMATNRLLLYFGVDENEIHHLLE